MYGGLYAAASGSHARFLEQAGAALISAENHLRRGRLLAPAEACAAVAALPFAAQRPLHWRIEGSTLLLNTPNPCTISLHDVSGRQILRAEGTSLSLASLPTGVYVARVEHRGTVQFFRFWWSCVW